MPETNAESGKMAKEIQDIVEDEEKAEELKKVIEKKVEEQVKESISDIKNSFGEDRGHEDSEKDSEKPEDSVSRRSFLKKIGAGALGLGAASLVPTSAYQVKSNHGFDVYSDGTNYFDVNPGGPVEVDNANFKLSEGKKMIDDAGNDRIGFSSAGTEIFDDNGTRRIRAGSSSNLRLLAESNSPLDVRDSEQGNTGFQYLTGSKGTLELTNADLDVVNNKVRLDPAGSDIIFNHASDTGNVRNTLVIQKDGSSAWTLAHDYNNENLDLNSAGSGDLSISGTNLNISGNDIEQIGGTPAPSDGALRLANGAFIKARDNSDTDDINIIYASSSDNITLGAGRVHDKIRLLGNNSVDIDGQNLARVGGTTDATSGVIRLSNNTEINARDSTNSDDINLIGTDANDNIQLGVNDNSNRIDLFSTVSLQGHVLERVGGTTDANSGDIRLSNNSQIAWRDSGNNSDFDISFDSDDKFKIGANGPLTETIIRSNLSMDGNVINSVGGTNDAGAGAIRMANGADIRWNDGGNNDDALLQFNSSNDFQINYLGGAHNLNLTDGGIKNVKTVKGRDNDSETKPYTLTINDSNQDILDPEKSDFEGNGIYMIRSGRQAAIVNTQGGASTVQIHTDPNGNFDTTQGNPGTTNIFSDGTRYVIENQEGGSITYRVVKLC